MEEFWAGIAAWWQDLVEEITFVFIEGGRWKFLVTGLKNTLIVTCLAVVLGIVLGSLTAIVRSAYDQNHSQMKKGPGRGLLSFLNAIAKIYLTIIRGTPTVVQLMIMYYVIFAASNNKILIAVLAFGINSGAYTAEIIRAGIMSVEKGEVEAGRSLGMSYVETMWYIVLPQALKNVLPALGNEFITLLKETSVSGYVALTDLTKAGDIIRGRTFSAFLPLLAVAGIYLALVSLISWVFGKMERRMRASEH